MVQSISVRKLIEAAADVFQGNRIDALHAITRTAHGQHDTTSIKLPGNRITIVARAEDAWNIAQGKAIDPLDVRPMDKQLGLNQKMNFAGGHGAFTAQEPDGHKELRAPLKVLGASELSHDMPDINAEAIALAASLSSAPQAEVYPEVRKFATRVAMATFFGQDPNQYPEDMAAMNKAIEVAEHRIFKRIIKVEGSKSELLLSGEDESLSRLNSFIEGQLNLHQANADIDEGENESVISRLIDATGGPQSLSSAEIRAHIKTELCQALFAAIQTTSAGLSWALHDLARHPEIQDRLRQDVDRILADGAVDIQESRLPYLAQIIEESLRVHSVVPLTLPRCPVGADGRSVKNETTFVSLASIHHDPAHFPDPEKFDPDRMSPEAKKARPSRAFMPFFAGPHACPGQILYKTAASTALLQILDSYAISAPDAAYPKGHMVISTNPESSATLSFRHLPERPMTKLSMEEAPAQNPNGVSPDAPPPGCPYHRDI